MNSLGEYGCAVHCSLFSACITNSSWFIRSQTVGVNPYVNWLYGDLADGLVIFQVMPQRILRISQAINQQAESGRACHTNLSQCAPRLTLLGHFVSITLTLTLLPSTSARFFLSLVIRHHQAR